MWLAFAYAAGIAGLLWYSIYYLPFTEVTQYFGFALNVVQFGVLSLLSFLVYRQEKHYRGIFFQFWLLFAVLALAGPAIGHVSHWHGAGAGVTGYIEVLVLVHGLVLWTVSKILLTYVLTDQRRALANVLAVLVVLPTTGWLFWPYYWNPQFLYGLPAALDQSTFYVPFRQRVIIVDIVSLVVLLAFFLLKLRTDKPIGAYADTLLYFFGLMLLVNTIEVVAKVTSLELMDMTQWANGAVAAAMIVTLLLRLKYKSQTIAQYYESQCLSDHPRLDRRVGIFDRLILRSFFDQKAIGRRVFTGTKPAQSVEPRMTPRPPNKVVDERTV